ncbi:hypothetical protein [Paenibacillus methanolicus]|uniref:Uncharacterized protein n=1 Tax=Paenibacillus methanolicus TaxID=582686 RepID=A0A5S5BYP3_9BACL|nr:hypothetical protein [Paenibacillus methanolicus]TYP72069.1 hypothetical protein BCM02_109348 [Paenibacillus methanolicus]
MGEDDIKLEKFENHNPAKAYDIYVRLNRGDITKRQYLEEMIEVEYQQLRELYQAAEDMGGLEMDFVRHSLMKLFYVYVEGTRRDEMPDVILEHLQENQGDKESRNWLIDWILAEGEHAEELGMDG